MSGTCHWSNWKQTILWRAMIFFCVVFVFVCSPLVPSITHYYTSYECHILHWLEDNQSFILCVISYVWAARQISFETTFCSETAFHSVLLEGLNRTSCVCVSLCVVRPGHEVRVAQASQERARHLNATWLTKGYAVFGIKKALFVCVLKKCTAL